MTPEIQPGRPFTTPSPRLPGWALGPCQYHADGDLWHVVVIHVAVRGRQARREAMEATGPTEVAALDALVEMIEARTAR